MKRSFELTGALILLSCAGFAAQSSEMSPDLADGIAKYNAGQYAQALFLIRQAKYDASRAAEAHYYKGCIFAKLNQPQDAIKEFKLAKLLGKDSPSGKLAAQALSAYGESTQTDKAQAKAQATTSTAPAVSKVVDPPHLENAAKRITNQAQERINRVWTEARLPNAALQAMPTFYRPSAAAVPGFDSRYRYYESSRRSSSFYNSPEYAYHKQRAKGVAESAEGLVSLLTREDDGKGVYLVPQGTNLYVRNYEFGTSIDPPLIPLKTDMKMWTVGKQVHSPSEAASAPVVSSTAESPSAPIGAGEVVDAAGKASGKVPPVISSEVHSAGSAAEADSDEEAPEVVTHLAPPTSAATPVPGDKDADAAALSLFGTP